MGGRRILPGGLFMEIKDRQPLTSHRRDAHLPRTGVALRNLQMQISICSNHDFGEGHPCPPRKYVRPSSSASSIKPRMSSSAKAVILTDGKAGTVERVWLDELHGLRISIRGHDGKWPVSTIKFAEGY
jgi:hypothetical protein